MALRLEAKYGNAKIYVYDDLCTNVSPEEMERRKLKFREVMGKIAASYAIKGQKSPKEQYELDYSKEFSYTWYDRE